MTKLTVICWLAGDTGRYTGDLRAAIGRDLDELCAGAKDARNIAVWAAYDNGEYKGWHNCDLSTAEYCDSAAQCPGLGLVDWPNRQMNMADPKALMTFADYVMRVAPAEQYALIISSHGSGPKQQDVYPTRGMYRGEYYADTSREHVDAVDTSREHVDAVDTSREHVDAVDTSRGVIDKTSTTVSKTATVDLAFDDGSRQALSVAQLGEVCQHIASRGPLALVLMDACFMASVEVMEALVGTCSVVVASPEAIPGEGFPYDILISDWDTRITEELVPTFEELPARLGEVAVAAFADYYGRTDETASIVAVDMALVPELLETLDGEASGIVLTNMRASDPDFRYLGWFGLAARCVFDHWEQNAEGGLTVYVPERGPLPDWYAELPISKRAFGKWVKRMVEGE